MLAAAAPVGTAAAGGALLASRQAFQVWRLPSIPLSTVEKSDWRDNSVATQRSLKHSWASSNSASGDSAARGLSALRSRRRTKLAARIPAASARPSGRHEQGGIATAA